VRIKKQLRTGTNVSDYYALDLAYSKGTIRCRDMMGRDTIRTFGEMHNTMEDDTTRGMASSLHPHIGRNFRKLVCRPGTAQRHCRMDNITTE
jgi:hypothetical protein